MDARTTWDDQADSFDDEPDHGLADPETREAWRQLLRAVLPPPPADVVDLGCGTGTLSLLLAGEGFRVQGLDISPRMLAHARTKAAEAGVAVSFVEGDAADPPVSPAAYDVVLGRHVLWAMPDPATAWARWRALLRPGGTAVLVEGHWSTGGGLTAEEVLGIVGRHAVVRPMPEAVFWGREVDDERYLVMVPTAP